MRNKDYGADGPLRQIVMQNVKVGRAVGEDGSAHFGVRGIENLRSEWLGLALKLVRRIAARADVID